MDKYMRKTLRRRYPALNGGRWGAKSQPHRSKVEYIIGVLPVDVIEMPAPDTLRLVMHRPLTFREAFVLGRLNPNSPSGGIDEDSIDFILWWD